MKKYSLFFAFIWFSLGLKAQETAPNFLGYRYNMNIFNPAYAGEDGKNELNMSFRKQSFGLARRSYYSNSFLLQIATKQFGNRSFFGK